MEEKMLCSLWLGKGSEFIFLYVEWKSIIELLIRQKTVIYSTEYSVCNDSSSSLNAISNIGHKIVPEHADWSNK